MNNHEVTRGENDKKQPLFPIIPCRPSSLTIPLTKTAQEAMQRPESAFQSRLQQLEVERYSFLSSPALSGDSSVLVHPCDQSSHELTSVVPKSGKKILCRQASKKTSREEELSLEVQSWRKRRSPKQKTKKKSVKRSQSSVRFGSIS